MPLSKNSACGLVDSTMQFLAILEASGTTATFFTLGIVYEWFSSLVEEISRRGHEIAFHGYNHTKLQGSVLKEDLERCREFIAKYDIKGFRAPKMYICKCDADFLKKAGFKYDSSIYGTFNSSTAKDGFIEIPVSTYPTRNKKITFPRTLVNAIKDFEVPVGSGMLIGMLSGASINRVVRIMNKNGNPFITFIHPWQLTSLPMLKFEGNISDLFKLPYMVGLSRKKLECILETNSFVSVQKFLRESG
jgi:peptidoglycan/xylan/chitin deacetylase (PgdA/CDA1 family)